MQITRHSKFGPLLYLQKVSPDTVTYQGTEGREWGPEIETPKTDLAFATRPVVCFGDCFRIRMRFYHLVPSWQFMGLSSKHPVKWNLNIVLICVLHIISQQRRAQLF